VNGDVVNGDSLHPRQIVEFTKRGDFVTPRSNVDSIQASAFVIDTVRDGDAHFIASMSGAVVSK